MYCIIKLSVRLYMFLKFPKTKYLQSSLQKSCATITFFFFTRIRRKTGLISTFILGLYHAEMQWYLFINLKKKWVHEKIFQITNFSGPLKLKIKVIWK